MECRLPKCQLTDAHGLYSRCSKQMCFDLASLWAVVQNLAGRAAAQSWSLSIVDGLRRAFPPVDRAVGTGSHSVLKYSGGMTFFKRIQYSTQANLPFDATEMEFFSVCALCNWLYVPAAPPDYSVLSLRIMPKRQTQNVLPWLDLISDCLCLNRNSLVTHPFLFTMNSSWIAT